MDSKDFERIYACYNPEVGIDNSLETEKLFEDIYFECNMEPLFEQIFREAGVTGINSNRFVTPARPATNSNKSNLNLHDQSPSQNYQDKKQEEEPQGELNSEINKETLSNGLGAAYNDKGQEIKKVPNSEISVLI